MATATARTHDASRIRRLTELDGLRGCAALIVVSYHCIYVLDRLRPHGEAWWWFHHTPLALFVSGEQSVRLFFVLSGLVLALPFLHRPVPYAGFAVRRICRIWLPYLAAIVFAVVIREATLYGAGQHAEALLAGFWTVPLTPKLLAQHVLLIGAFDSDALDPPIWSLVLEMRISLIFPLLVIVTLRPPLWLSAGLALALPPSAALFRQVSPAVADTLDCVPLFMLGIALAAFHDKVERRYGSLPRRLRTLGLIAALALYTSDYWLTMDALPGFVRFWLVPLGACVIVVAALADDRLSPALRSAPVQYLGAVSYSLYVFHVPVLLGLYSLLYARIPEWLLIGVCVAASVATAGLFHRAVELPANRLGHRLARRWEDRN